MRSIKQRKGFVGTLKHVREVYPYPFAAVVGTVTFQLV